MRPTLRQFTYMIDHNGNFNSDSIDIIEFIDIDLPHNKVSIRLLTKTPLSYKKKTCNQNKR